MSHDACTSGTDDTGHTGCDDVDPTPSNTSDRSGSRAADRAPARSGSRSGLVIISGPSGVGKSSICTAVLSNMTNAVWSVSATTRPIRDGEISGQNYEFLDDAEFERREAEGAFLESATYCGHRYGTPKTPVDDAIRDGKIVVMEIDVQGAIQAAAKMPNSMRIFVLPPTPQSLRARLEGRNTERDEDLTRRLARADGEIATARDSGCYQHFVVNDDLEATIHQVMDIIQKETMRT